MNIVNVKAMQTGDRSAKVLWYLGRERLGAINVEIPFDSDSVEALAEMAVVRHLTLEDPQLPGPLRSGKGIRAVVTKGAIKKAAKGRSKITSMAKYSAFLKGRLAGIEIVVDHKNKMLPEEDTKATKTIQLNLDPHETVDTPALGPVKITDHAFNRFLERVDLGDANSPFASLVKRLSSPDLKRVKVPEEVIQKKIRKYEDGRAITIYRHPTENIHYGVLPSENGFALVTVFLRGDTLLMNNNEV